MKWKTLLILVFLVWKYQQMTATEDHQILIFFPLGIFQFCYYIVSWHLTLKWSKWISGYSSLSPPVFVLVLVSLLPKNNIIRNIPTWDINDSSDNSLIRNFPLNLQVFIWFVGEYKLQITVLKKKNFFFCSANFILVGSKRKIPELNPPYAAMHVSYLVQSLDHCSEITLFQMIKVNTLGLWPLSLLGVISLSRKLFNWVHVYIFCCHVSQLKTVPAHTVHGTAMDPIKSTANKLKHFKIGKLKVTTSFIKIAPEFGNSFNSFHGRITGDAIVVVFQAYHVFLEK